VPGLSGVIAVAAYDQTLALKQDGTVWAWGQNQYGQLGRGTTNPVRSTGANQAPAQVMGLPSIRAIAAGQYDSYAVGANGSAWTWGLGGTSQYGEPGAIGDGGSTTRLTPVQITGLSGVTAISNTYGPAFALLNDGSVWGWGSDAFGQLGGLAAGFSLVPVQISSFSGIAQISAGNSFFAAVTTGGTVNMSGDNSVGELGDGTFAQHTKPVLAVTTSDNGFLDLNVGQTPVVSAAQEVPFFVVSTGGITSTSATVATTIKYSAGVQGQTGSVFITAVVPPGSPLADAYAVSDARMKTSGAPPSQTVQLTQGGWQPVVNGQLTPYTTGVLGATSAALQILNGTDTTTLGGAQFCVGYSTGTQSTSSTVTSRTVATIPTPTAAAVSSSAPTCASAPAAVAPQTGYWYNPAESGRGYFIEYNGTKIFMATFLYDPSGRSTWYGAGPTALTGTSFSTPMTAYSGGQTLTGSYVGPTQGASPGTLSIEFSDAADGTMTWPGGTIPISRFSFAANGLSSPPTATQPQTGWWFNPAESGRGYSIEIQNNTAFIAAYMYDTSGNPVWYDSGPATLTANNTYQGNWTANTGGQTLLGSYHPPTGTTNAGNLTIQFSSPTAGMLTLPNGNQIPIQRFGF
jgi:hypothetical protein